MLDKAARKAKSRKQLLAMFAVSFLTLGGAYALYYAARQGGVWNTTNHGTFVQPPLVAADLNLIDVNGQQLTEGETWWLWVVAPGVCREDCEAALQQLRQLHVLLNKDADRLRRALLTLPDAQPSVLSDYPALEHLTGALLELEEGIYLVDPIGNLVLFYPLIEAGQPVLDDLKKLLKLSQIG